MEEALIQAVTHRVLEGLNAQLPPALLVGGEPQESLGYRYVTEKPYEAVVIGSLTPGQLLAFRNERALAALAEGIPVYLYTPGLPGNGCKNRALLSRFASAQRELKALGVLFIRSTPGHRLISAQEARRMKAEGIPVPSGATLTPLAREILET